VQRTIFERVGFPRASGWIEEINLTYVVVRVWDQRRLVVPITYFIDKPFQNWTRTTAELLGTVLLYADYSVSVQDIRDELERVLSLSVRSGIGRYGRFK
jgi:small-conductance mechanosensitive channel